jgi:hypothetical protein
MARAKKMIRKSEREALKERRRSGEFKQDKKDARAAGLSRGEARKRAKRLSRVQALSKRKAMRADMADNKRRYIERVKQESNVKRDEARAKGQKLAGEGRSKPIYSMADVAPGGVPTRKIKSGDKVSKERIKTGLGKGMYKIVGADGYVRYSKSKPAMYGAKVKVKKAEKGAALKSVPSKAKGLSKLPKGVRNKMGYMQDGGKLKSKSFGVLKSDANKAKKAGPKLENKPPYSRNGINYTWDRKQGVYVGDLGDNYAVKKMKDGGKVVKRGMEQRPAKPFRTMKEIEDRRNEEKKAKRLIKK